MYWYTKISRKINGNMKKLSSYEEKRLMIPCQLFLNDALWDRIIFVERILILKDNKHFQFERSITIDKRCKIKHNKLDDDAPQEKVYRIYLLILLINRYNITIL